MFANLSCDVIINGEVAINEVLIIPTILKSVKTSPLFFER